MRDDTTLKRLYRVMMWNSSVRSRDIIDQRHSLRYRLTRIIGHGATGVAYLAEVFKVDGNPTPLRNKRLAQNQSNTPSKLSKTGNVISSETLLTEPSISDWTESEKSAIEPLSASTSLNISACSALSNPRNSRFLEPIQAYPINDSKPQALLSNPILQGGFEIESESPVEVLERNGLTVVMKFSSDQLRLAREMEVDKCLSPDFQVGFSHVYECNNGDSCIVGDYHHQITRTVFCDPRNIVELQVDDMSRLLLNILHIHEKGFNHRDVRLPNILRKRTGNVLLSDFGESRQVDRNLRYSGSFETASQRILLILTRKRIASITFSLEDDLESLLKCYIIYFQNLEVPKGAGYDGMFTFWMKQPLVGLFVELRGVEARIDFLNKIFSSPMTLEQSTNLYLERTRHD